MVAAFVSSTFLHIFGTKDTNTIKSFQTLNKSIHPYISIYILKSIATYRLVHYTYNMNLSSSSTFSPHNDVLSASPSTTSEKLSLIEELKRRGRISVTSKRYPDAKDLYTKAIDTLLTITGNEGDANTINNDIAVLYSNRSLCNLQMNKANDSYDDALNATCHDESYVKGFWRLGQASMALKRTEEALIAYEKALALDNDNKALKKECDKVKVQLEQEKKQAEEEAARKANAQEEEEAPSLTMKKKDDTKPAFVKSAASTMSSKSTSSSTKEEKKDESSSGSGDFSKSDHVRGYKIVNGKKTSFFHHEQTEEEKRLIGDITPQRIDPGALPEQTGPTKVEETGTSAWNKAGTWEEKDVTDWAIDSLKEIISDCEYDLPDGSPDPNAHVQVTKIEKLLSSKLAGGSSHASVATVRGKKRYIFEFTVCVHWEMTLGDGRKCKGQMTFLDVDGTHEIGDGYDMSDYIVDSDTPSDSKYLLERFVRDGGLRSVLEKAMDDWICLFRETY